MARFGLLHLANGNWNGEQVFDSEGYFKDAKSTSQSINKAYGYLWWLNGKESFHLPNRDQEFQGSIIPTAPNDMYMALGKNDQKIYIVPSQDLVVIRMGDSANDVNFALSNFDQELWEKISALNCMLSTSATNITEKGWLISPNPVTNVLNISQVEEFHYWKLTNILGQQFLSGTTFNIDVAELITGQYILTIYDKEQKVVGVERLVKK